MHLVASGPNLTGNLSEVRHSALQGVDIPNFALKEKQNSEQSNAGSGARSHARSNARSNAPSNAPSNARSNARSNAFSAFSVHVMLTEHAGYRFRFNVSSICIQSPHIQLHCHPSHGSSCCNALPYAKWFSQSLKYSRNSSTTGQSPPPRMRWQFANRLIPLLSINPLIDLDTDFHAQSPHSVCGAWDALLPQLDARANDLPKRDRYSEVGENGLLHCNVNAATRSSVQNLFNPIHTDIFYVYISLSLFQLPLLIPHGIGPGRD